VRSLLDVNVLIALLDAAHIAHTSASRWAAAHLHEGWASCPITQNGCIRIMSQPAYPGAIPAAQVAARLAEAAQHGQHAFWPDSLSLLQPGAIDWSRMLGHRQVTDSYLLALAVSNKGRLVTFDARVAINAVPGAQRRHLLVL